MTDKSRPWMPLGSLVHLQRTLWLVLYLCPQIQMFSFCFLPLDGLYPNFKAFGLFFSPKDFDLLPSWKATHHEEPFAIHLDCSSASNPRVVGRIWTIIMIFILQLKDNAGYSREVMVKGDIVRATVFGD